MEQKDLFPERIKKEIEQGPALFYRVIFNSPFEPEEPREVEVMIHGRDDSKAAIDKARLQGNFPEDQFTVGTVERFNPLSEEEKQRKLAQALPHLFKKKKI